jgi:hypothetical protein
MSTCLAAQSRQVPINSNGCATALVRLDRGCEASHSGNSYRPQGFEGTSESSLERSPIKHFSHSARAQNTQEQPNAPR